MSESKLPPLPEADYVLAIEDRPYDPGYITTEIGYSAGQLTAYAESYATAALSAQSAELAAAKEEVARLRTEAERWRFVEKAARLDKKCGCPPGPNWWLPVFADCGFNTFGEVIDAARAALATNQDKS